MKGKFVEVQDESGWVYTFGVVDETRRRKDEKEKERTETGFTRARTRQKRAQSQNRQARFERDGRRQNSKDGALVRINTAEKRGSKRDREQDHWRALCPPTFHTFPRTGGEGVTFGSREENDRTLGK